MGGSDDHPSVTNFLQLFRLMCVYIPTSLRIRGNISDGQEDNSSLLELAGFLFKGTKLEKDKRSMRRAFIDDEILQKITDQKDSTSSHHLMDHDYCKSSVEDGILFYLAGYVAKKAQRFTSCQNCLSSLYSFDCPPIAKALVSKMKCIGTLHYPREPLYTVVKNIEIVCQDIISSSELWADPVSSIIERLKIPKAGIGCGTSDHSENLIVRIVSFYISVRMFFFVKNHNSVAKGRKKTKVDRKKVKLN